MILFILAIGFQWPIWGEKIKFIQFALWFEVAMRETPHSWDSPVFLESLVDGLVGRKEGLTYYSSESVYTEATHIIQFNFAFEYPQSGNVSVEFGH